MALRLGAAAPALAALGQVAADLVRPPAVTAPGDVPCCSRFDRCVDGLNRLPRPLLTLGVLACFGHAWIDPPGFAHRMRALAEIPEPLWWLFGAVVTFYFGARETHYRRSRGTSPVEAAENPALAEWGAGRDSRAHGLSDPAAPYQGP